ncbi:MAG TPA: hypothetical protein VHB51_02160 [Candidatus Saccharimonadales bacterium]|nr:hypothetical protein [Candidatus Saccharimonadales bacterium]
MDLLHAYSNTSVEVAETLRSLGDLPTVADEPVVTSPPRKLRARLPRSIVSKLVADYQAGSSSRTLAAKYEMPRSSVLRLLDQEGVLRPRIQTDDALISKACELIAAGSSVIQAAEQLGINKRTLYHQLKVRGLPTRRS